MGIFLTKFIHFLELFSDGKEHSFSELQKESGLSRSNVSHLLETLCSEEIIVRCRRGIYQRGTRLMHLGGMDAYTDIRRIARYCCIMTRDMINEVAVVALRQGINRITIVKLHPGQDEHIVGQAEDKYPVDWYGTATGRVLMAYASRETLTAIVRKFGLPEADIWKEAGTMPKLEKELAAIREQGFAAMTLDEERSVIAVPVHDVTGEPTLSLAVCFPLSHHAFQDAKVLEQLRICAAQFEQELHANGIRLNDLANHSSCPVRE